MRVSFVSTFHKPHARAEGAKAIGKRPSDPRRNVTIQPAPLHRPLRETTSAMNLLLIHCHDLGRHLRCYANPTVHTPHLDRLAARGVLLENHFCTAPQCSPSRAALFTGRYPHRTGVMGLAHGRFAWDMAPGVRHLARILTDHGHRCHAVGIFHESRDKPEAHGFASHRNAILADDMATETIALLRECSGSETSFYIQAGCLEPHRLPEPEPTKDMGFTGGRIAPDTSLGTAIPPWLRDTPGTRTEIAELQGAIRHMDRAVGRILDFLDESGLDKKTLVVFTTDHGLALPRAKCSLYDPGLHAACIVRHPTRNGWSHGKRISALLENVDVAPTLLEALGLPVPPDMDGRSFAPLVDGKPYRPRTETFAQITWHDYYDPRRSIRTARHKLIVNFSTSYSFMDPSQSWRPRSDTKVPGNHAHAYHVPVELYDLENDPWEQRNIADDPGASGVLDALRRTLLEHLRRTDDPILRGAVTPPAHHTALALLEAKP